jgi:ion channel-forming bestrophin family protein
MPIDFFEGQRQVNSWGSRMNAFRLSTVFKKTTGACLVLGVYVAVGRLIENYFEWTLHLDFDSITLLGGVMSLLLVLRSNSAYERWWEGRKLWGQLVNDSRNLALKIMAMVDAPEKEKFECIQWSICFPYLLRDHLRNGIPKEDALALAPEEIPEYVSHLPAYVSGKLFSIFRRWRDAGHLNKLDHHLIDQHISALMDICGACERIRNTPPPMSHRALIPQLLVIYLVITPLTVEPSISNATMGFGLAYFLIGLEVLAEELEEPFGMDTDDLPIDKICGNIQRSLSEIRKPIAET